MSTTRVLLATAIACAFPFVAIDTAKAQGMQDGMRPGMMQRGADRDTTGRGMMQGGSNMEQCMMHGMAPGAAERRMSHGMMSSGMMGSGMMGSGMMGSGMMQGSSRSGMSALFGSRVTPIMNLSVDDVRGYLDLQLERLNNKRLKVGDLKSDEGMITADIVTVDNSLVQQLKVNRHTGAIEYAP